MKPDKIQIGKTYANSGAGRTRRVVLDIGTHIRPEWFGRGEPPKEPGVQYAQLGIDGKPLFRDTLCLSSFAKWAGKEVEE